MIEIKRASIIHLNILCPLFELYRKFYQMNGAEIQAKAFLSLRLKQKDSLILIAFVDQQAAGFVQTYPSFSSVAMKPILILNDLFVNADYRKQGVAKKLMLAVEEKAKQNKIFSVKLATATNNSAAKALYQHLNYQLIDNFEQYSKRMMT